MNRNVRVALVVYAGLFAGACSGNPASPTGPTAAATTFTLSGQVTSSSGGAVAGATIRVVDGPNAGRSTVSDTAGGYSLSALTKSGFTLNVSAPNFSPTSMGVTLTSNQVLNVPLSPLFTDVVGAWSGTITSVGLGISLMCNGTWLVTSQAGGDFSGTFQIAGGNGCSQAGTFAGSISSANGVTAFRATSTSVGNGAICTDSNVTTTGLLSGRTMTIQRSFTRSCTSPPPPTTFAESQTISMTRQ